MFQANRKQSLNYGCIVENEKTDEVIVFSVWKGKFDMFEISNTLLQLIFNWLFLKLKAIINKILIVSLYPPGLALCREAQHICEWYNQLWNIPVHSRDIPAHWRSFPEEPTGHAVVSGTNPVGFLSGSACILDTFFFSLVLFICFPPSNSFLSAIILFPVPSSDIRMRGKFECGLKLWFGYDLDWLGSSVM